MKTTIILLFALLFALIGQSFLWHNLEYIDENMWANQALYVDTKDPRAFDILQAYGHPGTVTVEIAILVHRIFGTSYTAASKGALIILNSCTIASCITLAYILRPKNLWYLAVAGLLITNTLFANSTPPTATVAPLIVLIILLALYICEQGKKIQPSVLIGMGIAVGLSASSRADITGMVAAPLLLFLARDLSFRKLLQIVLIASLTFFITNPFMWDKPVSHLYDLVNKGNIHYANFSPNQLSLTKVLLLSPLATLGFGFALIFVVNNKKLPEVIPKKFLLFLLTITVVIFTIFLTAVFQAPRYFFPLLFVWEVFLPLFLFELANKLRMKRLAQVAFATLFIVGPTAMLMHLWLTPVLLLICC